jgi:hypothetical protein
MKICQCLKPIWGLSLDDFRLRCKKCKGIPKKSVEKKVWRQQKRNENYSSSR